MLRKQLALWVCAALVLVLCVPIFAAAEVSGVHVDTSSALWVVTWSSEDESMRLSSVQLSGASGGSATLSVLSGRHGYAEVDASGAPYGTSSVDLAFGSEDSPESTVVSGGTFIRAAQLQMSVATEVKDDVFAVRVTDEYGNPVAGAFVSVDIGSTIGAMTATTDDYGGASFHIAGIEGGFTWTVHAVGFDTGDGVTYLTGSASQIVGEETVTTHTPEPTVPPTAPTVKPEPPEVSEADEPGETSEARETSPRLPTLPADETDGTLELPTYEAVRGATTTNALKEEIACNLAVDKSLLSALKMKIGAFDKHGRLIVSKKDYEALATLYGGTPMGSLTVSPYKAVTKEQIETAKKGESMFSDSSADKALAVTFGLALDFLMADGESLHVTDVSDGGEAMLFEVRLPVPSNMKKCKSYGVAMTGENTLTTLTQVKAENGVISFSTAALGYYTLVGFTDGKAAAAIGGGSPLTTLFVLLIAVGVLMLGACGFLTYWFFFRKGKPLDPLDYATPEDAAYYDGETPADEQAHADEEAFMREVLGERPAGGQDVFSSEEREREVRDPILSAREEVERGGDDIFGLYSRRIDE